MLLPIMIAVALQASPILDRCHKLYTEIGREILRQKVALDTIESCLQSAANCSQAKLDTATACALGTSNLAQMIDEMTEFSRHNPSCRDRFGVAINREVTEMLDVAKRIEYRLDHR